MNSKEYFDWLESHLFRYRLVIGILVIFLLVTLIIATFINFDKQNQIIETGGFIDGKIKCVCDEGIWNEYQSRNARINSLNFTINQSNG